jgi:uncharacterized membrane protein
MQHTPTPPKRQNPDPKDSKGGSMGQDPLSRLTLPDAAEPSHFAARLRNYFLTGLVVAGPIAITVYAVKWVVTSVDAWVKPFVPSLYNPESYLPFNIPGIGLIFSIIGLTLFGALAANLIGRTIVSYSELMVGRMPVVRNVYRALKQIFETVLTQKNGMFKQVALIEFPGPGLWSVVFVAADAKGEIQERLGANGEQMVGVFLPTVPPTTGYVVYMPKKNLVVLDMSVEDAAKLLLSAGLVIPEYPKPLAAPPVIGATANNAAMPGPGSIARTGRPVVDAVAPLPANGVAEAPYAPPRPNDRPR